MWARYEASNATMTSLGRGVVAGILLVSLGYSGPCNAFISMYPAEIMPTSIRTVGCAVSYAALHLVIILLVQVTPMAVEAISWRYFLIFLVCSCCFIVVFYVLYPETKGKTLEDIEAIFGDKVGFAHMSDALKGNEANSYRSRRRSTRPKRRSTRRLRSSTMSALSNADANSKVIESKINESGLTTRVA